MKLFSFSSRCRWVLGFFALGGCVSGGNSSLSTVTDALEGMKGSGSPFVEAYIQDLGADPRWAGPVLWTVHVSAREGGAPLFEVSPALPQLKESGAPELSSRVPASALGLTQGRSVPPAASRLLSAEQVRDRLGHLATAMASGGADSAACVHAIRVRLTREDGSVVEKQGCRGSAAWTQAAGELSAEFMALSRYPRPQPAVPAPLEAKPAAGSADPGARKS